MIDFETILEAYLDCRKRKRSTVGATEFELDYVHNLVELMNEVNSRQYKIGKSICFVVRYPRYREVFAGEFRDRIIHHYIALRLEPLFEQIFCDRAYNCRKGKGQLAGVTQLAEDIREESENYTKDAYVMKVDLKGFFMSIIKSKLAKMVDDFIVERYEGDDKEDLRWICNLVVMHRPELNCERRSPLWMWNFIPKEKSLFTNGDDRGIAIGNLFAQLFANFLLNVIDWKIDAVCRYVDDISFVSKDKWKLLSIVPMLRTELGKLGLRLNEKKFYLQHYSKGVQFTGAIIKPGRIYVANHTINSFALAVKRLGKAAEMGMVDDIKKEISSVNSYLGIMSRYNEYATKRRIMAKLPPKFYEYCYIEGHFDVVKLKYKYTEKAIFMNIAKNIINKRDEKDIRENSDREENRYAS
nr:MAG TPA: hypothetical protein [Caudoviricetes sp.]